MDIVAKAVKGASASTTTTTTRKSEEQCKITTLHVQHTFLHISLPSLHDYFEKSSNGTFYGGRKHTTVNFFFLFLTWVRSPRIQFRGDLLSFDISFELKQSSSRSFQLT